MVKIVCNFLSTLLLVVLLILAGVLIIPYLFGFKEMAVLSGSMEPKIPVGSIVYVKELSFEELVEKDVITYKLSETTFVTHRIEQVNKQDNTLITKGDANEDPDQTPVQEDQVVGKMYFSIPLLGYISIYGKTPIGVGVICGLLMLIILLNFLPDIFIKEEKKDVAL